MRNSWSSSRYWWISSASARAEAQVVAERLLHHDARALRQPRLGQSLDDHPEQRRRNLEVEDRAVRVADRLRDARVGVGVGEVTAQVGEAPDEALEDFVVVELSRVASIAAPRALAQVVERPVVGRDADDRAAQQAAALEAVERVERHHLGEVAGDAEDHEHVGRLRAARGLSVARTSTGPHGCAHAFPFG